MFDDNAYSYKTKTSAYIILYRTIRDIVQKARRRAALDFGYADSAYNMKVLGPYFQQGDADSAYNMKVLGPYFKQGDSHLSTVLSFRSDGKFKITKNMDDHLYVIDLGWRDKLFNISKLKRIYIKNKYSPERSSTHIPNSVDCTSTSFC